MVERSRFPAACIGALLLFAGFGLSQASAEDESAAVPDVAATAAPADAGPLQAVWKPQEFDFFYQSFTTFYSCSSLSEKVRRVLLGLGADEKSIKVRVSGCESGSGIARMPVVRVRMIAPVEATPDALAELAKSRPQRELAARVRNDRAKSAQLDEKFPAQWKRVSLSRGSFGLSPGDCELVEQMQRKVLPRLAVRVISSNVRCLPNQISLGQPRLEVEALAELPKADDAAATPLPAGEGDEVGEVPPIEVAEVPPASAVRLQP